MSKWPASPCVINARLEPCPMCGGKAACNNYITEAAVFCVNVKCRLSIKRGHGRSDEGVDEAIAVWNTRATAAPVVVGEVYVASSDVEAMVALKGRVADAGSQSRYAKSMGVSEAYVSDVLNGKRPIPEAWVPGFAKGWLRVNTDSVCGTGLRAAVMRLFEPGCEWNGSALEFNDNKGYERMDALTAALAGDTSTSA